MESIDETDIAETLELLQWQLQEEKSHTPALLAYLAFYTGIGYKTAMGLDLARLKA